MKTLMTTAALTLTILPALPAMAQDFTFRGGRVDATAIYANQGFVGGALGKAGGAFEFGLTDNTFVQVDAAGYGVVGLGALAGFSAAAGEIGAHLGVDLSDDAALGVFTSVAYANPGPSVGMATFGAEVIAPVGPFKLEAYAAYSRDLNGLGGSFYALDAMLYTDLDAQWSIGAGAHLTYLNPGITVVQPRLALRYDFAPDFSAEGFYAYNATNVGFSAHSVGLRLTKTFGGGTTFGSRDQSSLLTGF
ncbi:MAG TPA: hypothetical protein ENK63_04690 [Rhodobacterales bacterium]|nr:hypothetical protein [Rhodobacterales bacterium]